MTSTSRLESSLAQPEPKDSPIQSNMENMDEKKQAASATSAVATFQSAPVAAAAAARAVVTPDNASNSKEQQEEMDRLLAESLAQSFQEEDRQMRLVQLQQQAQAAGYANVDDYLHAMQQPLPPEEDPESDLLLYTDGEPMLRPLLQIVWPEVYATFGGLPPLRKAEEEEDAKKPAAAPKKPPPNAKLPPDAKPPPNTKLPPDDFSETMDTPSSLTEPTVKVPPATAPLDHASKEQNDPPPPVAAASAPWKDQETMMEQEMVELSSTYTDLQEFYEFDFPDTFMVGLYHYGMRKFLEHVFFEVGLPMHGVNPVDVLQEMQLFAFRPHNDKFCGLDSNLTCWDNPGRGLTCQCVCDYIDTFGAAQFLKELEQWKATMSMSEIQSFIQGVILSNMQAQRDEQEDCKPAAAATTSDAAAGEQGISTNDGAEGKEPAPKKLKSTRETEHAGK